MTKKSLIWLLCIALLYIGLQLGFRFLFRGNAVLNQSLSILYLWSPGIVALVFAHLDKVRFPAIAKPNRSFWLIPVVTLSICLIAFIVCIPFGIAKNPNPIFVGKSFSAIFGYGALFLATNYLFATIIGAFIFFGGELYFRGYLWEKWKKKTPLKGIWLTALVWAIWQSPITILSYSPGVANFALNLGWIFALNFALAPVLAFFREKGKSVLAATFFYSSLMASFLYFLVLFPSMNMKLIAIYGVLIILGLVIFSLIKKLYSSTTWKKLI